MINWILVLLIVFMFLGIKNSKNPMKMSFLILVATALIFLMLQKETGSIWFPLIFFMLFTGGILMMFMILSSVLPNEKVNKAKIPKTIAALILIFCSTLIKKETIMKGNLELAKSLISSSLFFAFMTTIILLYFFNSMNLNSTEEYSMRSFQCR